MGADRTDVGRLSADDNVTAVRALPDAVAVAREHQTVFYIVEQLEVTCLVLLFDRADHLEQVCDMVEAFLARFPCKGCIHIGPLVVFAGCCGLEVRDRIIDTSVEQLKPDFCVLLFVCRRFLEDLCDLDITVLSRFGGKVGVFVARHGLTGERRLEIRLGFCALQISHNGLLLSTSDVYLFRQAAHTPSKRMS